MKRLDYYILMGTLLIGGSVCLYFNEDMYAGMFLGVFFTFVKDLLGLKENKEEEIYLEPMK